MCDDNNVTLIEVPYTVKDIPTYLYNKLKPLGYLNSLHNFNGIVPVKKYFN